MGSHDWSSFKQYIYSKYAPSYAIGIFEHARKYQSYLNDVNQIMLVKPTVRNNIINALIVLTRYRGTYDTFKNQMKIHGITRYKPDPIAAFTRIFNSNAHDGLGKWYNDAMAVLNDNEKLYLRYMALSGLRAMEGINSFNLMADMGSKYTTEYYNENTKFLEHFRFPKLFLRNSKNCYVSCVPKSLLDEISNSTKISYIAIDKRLNRANLPMKIKKLRSYYATEMRKLGLLSEQIDLLEGRIGKSIFLMHYFKENPKLLSDNILGLLPVLENNLKSEKMKMEIA
ncbi:MAG TPA: integrase [Candidatus Limnocylindrales bacterium]|nr:integrase [Candidatus Limnocylindrales bacterium]